MRNYYSALIIITLVACGDKPTQDNGLINIQIEVDTVHLDAKGEILFLGYNLSLSDFSEDRSLL